MNSKKVETADDIAETAGVSESVAESVLDGLVEMVRRVGYEQATVFLTRQPANPFAPEEEAEDYIYTAVGARLVFDYKGADKETPSYTVENIHTIVRIGKDNQFTDDLEAEGDTSLVVLNDGAVIDKTASAFCFRLSSTIEVSPITRLVLRIEDYEISKEIDGIGHDLPRALRGRMHYERFPLMDRYVVYLNEGDEVFEKKPSFESEEDETELTVQVVEHEKVPGMVIDGQLFIQSELIETFPDGFSTIWGGYSDDDAVDAVAKANVLPPLTTKQIPPTRGHIHYEDSLEGEPTRLMTDLPTNIYGDADES